MRPAFYIYIFDNEPVVKPINVVPTNLRRISTFNIKKRYRDRVDVLCLSKSLLKGHWTERHKTNTWISMAGRFVHSYQYKECWNKSILWTLLRPVVWNNIHHLFPIEFGVYNCVIQCRRNLLKWMIVFFRSLRLYNSVMPHLSPVYRRTGFCF